MLVAFWLSSSVPSEPVDHQEAGMWGAISRYCQRTNMDTSLYSTCTVLATLACMFHCVRATVFEARQNGRSFVGHTYGKSLGSQLRNEKY